MLVAVDRVFGIYTISAPTYVAAAFSSPRRPSPMRACIRTSVVALVFGFTSFVAPLVGGGEPDDAIQDSTPIDEKYAEIVEKYNKVLKQGRLEEALELGWEA